MRIRARTDRIYELTQLDVEMSFAEPNDIMAHRRGVLHGGVRALRREAAAQEALAAHDIRGRDAPLRERSARHAFRDGADRPHRDRPWHRLRRVQGCDRAGRRGPRARRARQGGRVAEGHRRLGRDRQDARRQGPRVVRLQRLGREVSRWRNSSAPTSSRASERLESPGRRPRACRRSRVPGGERVDRRSAAAAR